MKIDLKAIINFVESNKAISLLDRENIFNSLSLLNQNCNSQNVFIVIKEISELENEFNLLQIKEVIKLIEQSLS